MLVTHLTMSKRFYLLIIAGFFLGLAYSTNLFASFNLEGLNRQEKKSSMQAEVLRERIVDCNTSDNYKKCYIDMVRGLLKQYEIQVFLTTLKQLESDSEVFKYCHELTHYVGQEAYQLKGSIAEAYRTGEHVCYGGYFHGTLEGYFIERDLSIAEFGRDPLKDLIVNICGKEGDFKTSILYRECLHGIGHGLMFLTNMDLPGSLALCDSFKNKSEAELCYGGVFMENSTSTTNPSHTSRWIKKDDPMYPCNVLEEQYLGLCYEYQSIYFSHLTSGPQGENNWQEVVDLCLQVPEKHQDGCFFIIGTNQPSVTSSASKMKENCNLIPTEVGRRECVVGVVVALSGWYIGNAQPMIEFCSLVDSKYKQSCFSQIGSSITTWGQEFQSVESVCEQIEEKQYATWCKQRQDKPRSAPIL